MRRLIALFILWFCVTLHAATPSFNDFDPTQFQANPTGPEPKISLLVGGIVTNYQIISITNTILVSSNVYSTNLFTTNITVQTTTITTNNTFMSFITNQYVTFEVVSNAFFTNVVIQNGVGPWIQNLEGFGTNTTIYGLTVNNDFYVVGTGAPVFDLINGDTQIGQAGFDGTNWYGSGGDLTNLFILAGANIVLTTNANGSLTISASSTLTNATIFATNVVSGGTLAAATIGAFTGDITTPGGSYATTLKNTGTAGTYRSVTFDAQGRETSGSNPTTFSGYGLSDSSANLFSALTDYNGNTWTNIHYIYTTNAVPSSGSLAFGGNAYTTNLQADITLASFASVSAVGYETLVLFATNSTSTDHTITMAGGVFGPNGVNPAVFYCTNQHMTRILVEHYGQNYTNASKLDL